jgi:U3 small nucleolar RNA-associated protein 14
LLPTATAAGGGGGHNKPSKSHVKHFKKSRAKATANALDAFARAAEQVGDDSPARGVRRRALDDDDDDEQHPGKRQRRGEDDDDEDEDGDEDLDGGERGKKRPRREQGGEDGFDGFSDDDGAAGSDSEEWHIGVGGEDEDSELDSDEAFGESDEERFEGFGFAGSNSKGGRKRSKRKTGDEEGDSEEQDEEEDDLESLGSDAIDLATALDQFSEEDDDEEQEGSGSDEEDEDEESTDADDESEEDEDDESKLDALQSMIAGFAGGDDEEGEQQTGSQGKPKLSLKDLGLAGVKDPHIKRALRLMNKEEKAVKPGSSKKLDVPLAKRQQDRLLRSAAYEKTNETLGRWVETVKHNRRADHLVFPLAQNAHDRGLDGAELMPISQKTSGTELEQTILAIMEESGLGPSAKAEKKEEGDGTGQNGLTQAEMKEIARQRRRERELHSREMARAKRIKKIKSKTYRRIHRKELAREQDAEHEAALANGELDSEDERELLDRRRALERVGTRHRESKWAKLGKKAGRAVWDENFRAGLTEMAQRKEELRRRIEGRTGGSDDDDDGDGSDVSDASEEGDNRHRLLAELDRAAAYEEEDEAPQSKLMQMKFMQRGEELRKKENDEAIAELRRQLDSDNEAASDEEMEIGRRQYGMGNSAVTANASAAVAKRANAANARGPANSTTTSGRPESALQSRAATQVQPQSSASGAAGAWTTGSPPPSAPAAAGVWSQVEPSGRKSKKVSKAKAEEVDVSSAVTLSIKSSKPKPTSDGTAVVHADGGQDSDDDADLHLPMAIRDQKLIERAFAGEDVHGQFEEEKAEIERDDDEKEIDNTLPGWGSWVGEGVSNREKRRHQGRFITKVEGVKKRDRKDFRLKDVIISEKRIKKVRCHRTVW